MHTEQLPLTVRYWSASDQGDRERQEDLALTIRGNRSLVAAVFDGVGGHVAGEVAAATVADTFDRLYRGGYRAQDLGLALGEANQAVLQRAKATRRHGMGTTAVALTIDPLGAYVGHAGDSRCYRLREGVLQQITEDHAPTEEDIRRAVLALEMAYVGLSSARLAVVMQETRVRMRNTIRRCLGTDEKECGEVRRIDAFPGDVYLLCSDGLNALPLDHVQAVLANSTDPAQALVDAVLALQVRGQDNVTAVVVRVERT